MLQLKKNFQKFWIILLSRINKPKNQEWIDKRRSICKVCEWNSLNNLDLSFKKKLYKFLSDLYSKITFNKDVDTLGNCTACDMCSIYFKTETDIETCPKNKWKK